MIFDSSNRTNANTTLFLSGSQSIARYDAPKYPFLEKLTDKQLSFFWRPEEVEIYRDASDFKGLTDGERHIFTSNLKRQILLDSVQGRAPVAAFGPISSVPELEVWLQTWTFFETIHSRSYTHIIRNVYPNPTEVFDSILDVPEIVECASDISRHYDALIVMNVMNTALTAFPRMYAESPEAQYNHKKYLWLALNSVNVLEGIRFYVSFACSWAFAETKRMEGNAKIIKLIARDENLHLAGTQQLLKTLPNDDPDFVRIRDETRDECAEMFISAAKQEKAWAKYLFSNGSMVGLNERLLSDYVEWLTNRRMHAVGLESPFKGGSNPLPWTQRWISGGEVQVAPQETEIASYQIGNVVKDVSGNTFSGFRL
jgi:ribonucleoside-diphosphate reductase beta chain